MSPHSTALAYYFLPKQRSTFWARNVLFYYCAIYLHSFDLFDSKDFRRQESSPQKNNQLGFDFDFSCYGRQTPFVCLIQGVFEEKDKGFGGCG